MRIPYLKLPWSGKPAAKNGVPSGHDALKRTLGVHVQVQPVAHHFSARVLATTVPTRWRVCWQRSVLLSLIQKAIDWMVCLIQVLKEPKLLCGCLGQ